VLNLYLSPLLILNDDANIFSFWGSSDAGLENARLNKGGAQGLDIPPSTKIFHQSPKINIGKNSPEVCA